MISSIAVLVHQAWKKPVILGTQRPPWNPAAITGDKICKRSSSQLIDTSKRTPREILDDAQRGWNVSTQLTTKEVLEKVLLFAYFLK